MQAQTKSSKKERRVHFLHMYITRTHTYGTHAYEHAHIAIRLFTNKRTFIIHGCCVFFLQQITFIRQCVSI